MRFNLFPPRKKEIALFDVELKECKNILNKNDYEIIYCEKKK